MFEYKNNKKIFKYGLVDYNESRKAASACNYFKEDDEDEQVDSEIESCYNCIFRRWKTETFECMKRIHKL